MKKLSTLVMAALIAAPMMMTGAAFADGKGSRGIRSGASHSARVAVPQSSGRSSRGGQSLRLDAPRSNGGRHGGSLEDFAGQALGNRNDPRWRNNDRAHSSRDREFARRHGGDLNRYDWQDLRDYYNLDRNYSRNDMYRYLYGRDEHISDSYRDAAIANAIANVFGAILMSTTQPQVVVPVTPVYETQQVLVREGYDVSEKVWVPEYFDSATRTRVEGHYEMHSRWVPPVYETRQVRVR